MEILALPAHTSHFLQPLDQIFGELKSTFGDLARTMGLINSNLVIILNRFTQVLQNAMDKAWSPHVVKKSFRKTGMSSVKFEASLWFHSLFNIPTMYWILFSEWISFMWLYIGQTDIALTSNTCPVWLCSFPLIFQTRLIRSNFIPVADPDFPMGGGGVVCAAVCLFVLFCFGFFALFYSKVCRAYYNKISPGTF